MWIIPYVVIALGVIALDQISKLLILEFLYQDQLVLIEGVLNFTYVENRGMAFGLLSEHRWVFMVLSVVGIGLVAFYLFRYVKTTQSRVALALVVGGGIGNMIDRVVLGFVVDFIDFCLFDFWVWVFNIADAAVCVGAALFVLDMILEIVRDAKKPRHVSENAEGKENADG
jgi:signal peptidase II